MQAQGEKGWTWLFLAWIVALVATLGALFIGEVLGQVPCILCWYQRIAMFPLVISLGVGAFLYDRNVLAYSLPLVVAGIGFAAYHSLLYFGFIPEAIQPCTATGPSCSGESMTLFGALPLPLLSLVAFLLIAACLALVYRSRRS